MAQTERPRSDADIIAHGAAWRPVRITETIVDLHPTRRVRFDRLIWTERRREDVGYRTTVERVRLSGHVRDLWDGNGREVSVRDIESGLHGRVMLDPMILATRRHPFHRTPDQQALQYAAQLLGPIPNTAADALRKTLSKERSESIDRENELRRQLRDVNSYRNEREQVLKKFDAMKADNRRLAYELSESENDRRAFRINNIEMHRVLDSLRSVLGIGEGDDLLASVAALIVWRKSLQSQIVALTAEAETIKARVHAWLAKF